ncbi:unnamed protein product [Meganyctiphanes norvegica]|uniref:HECT-type E3 ubiquitin transferase n=1 Tax=Meganyctiphanes norvegica TaxID=48144 RepID=A0AAV2QU95_MEGNR
MAADEKQVQNRLLRGSSGQKKRQIYAVSMDVLQMKAENILTRRSRYNFSVTAGTGTGRLRQLCPFCGNFYNMAANTDIRLRQHRRESVPYQLQLPHLNLGEAPRFSKFCRFFWPSLTGSNPDLTNNNNKISLSKSNTNDNANNNSNNNRCLDSSSGGNIFSRLLNISDASAFRVGSGSSLPPIRRQEVDSRRGSSRATRSSIRSSRSEDRLSSRGTVHDLSSPHRPVYPARTTRREEFMQDVRKAKETKNYNDMKKFYFETFESYASIAATFKRDPDFDGALVDDPGLKMELVYTVHDALREMPSVIHKQFLKAVINSLLEERPHLFSKDRCRALFVILQSPVFLSQSSYTVLAHVLRNITTLTNGDHQLLVQWFRTLEVARLKLIVSFLIQFITVRQFPPPDRSLPPLNRSKWWIATSTKVLAILYASNSASQPQLLHYTEFYNHTLDHLDLMNEYRTWQIPDKPDSFSYCQYPFILSIVAKRHILTKDAEQQMILTARRSLVAKVARHQPPQIDIFFLNINVRRNHIVEDSLKEIAAKKRDLKKKLKVTFEGEPGLDMGGLTKEWFLLLIKQIFKPENAMFVYHPSKRLYWFAMGQQGCFREYNLIGVLMGLAVYNSIILDIRFPSICYRKLLSPPVVPAFEHMPVGITKNPRLDDLSEIMPEIPRPLHELLSYEEMLKMTCV